MKIEHSGNSIHFVDEEVSILGTTEYNETLWNFLSECTFSTKPSKKNPKYIFVTNKNKYLHRVIMEHYFGEAIVEQAYKGGMIIEHLDNNGFNCEISNLYFLLEIKNRYKGQHYDKLVKDNLSTVAFAIYHIISNGTFQITIGFNDAFINQSGEHIADAKFLYKSAYEIVLQDAESMIESIMSTRSFNLDEFKKIYRFCDCVVHSRIKLEPTKEEIEAGLFPGQIIVRDGVAYMLPGQTVITDDNGEQKVYASLIVKAAKEQNWI